MGISKLSAIPRDDGKASCTGSPWEHVRSAQRPDCCRGFMCIWCLVSQKVSESLVYGTMKTLRNHKTDLILYASHPHPTLCLGLNLRTCTSKAHDLPPNPTPSPPPQFPINPYFLLRNVLSTVWAWGTHAGKSFHTTTTISNELMSLERRNAPSFTTQVWLQ